ncbi:MAG: MFS transporter, partial [Marinoscillum sp.]
MASHLKYFLSSRESIFIGMVFACNSMLFGNWVTRIPDIKESLNLSDAELGLALLGAPVGALLIMPLSGWVIARFQLGRTVVFSAILHTASLPILALSNSFWALTVALVLFGFTNAIMDISMNAAAAGTEKQLRKPIMSTCHGMWSIGAMLGSGIGSLF